VDFGIELRGFGGDMAGTDARRVFRLIFHNPRTGASETPRSPIGGNVADAVPDPGVGFGDDVVAGAQFFVLGGFRGRVTDGVTHQQRVFVAAERAVAHVGAVPTIVEDLSVVL